MAIGYVGLSVTDKSGMIPHLMSAIGNTVATESALWFALVEGKRMEINRHAGETIDFPFMTSLGGNAHWYDSGAGSTGDTHTVTLTTSKHKGSVNWCELESPIAIPKLALTLGSGAETILSREKWETERAVIEATDKLGTALWTGGMEDNSDSAYRKSINGVCYWGTTAAMETTCGGVVRGTYTTFVPNVPASTVTQISINEWVKQFLVNQKYGKSGFFSAGTQNQWRKLWAEGKEHVRIITSEMGKRAISFNFPTIEIMGVPVVADAHAPTALATLIDHENTHHDFHWTSGAASMVIVHLPSWTMHIPPGVAGTPRMDGPAWTNEGSIAWRGLELWTPQAVVDLARKVGHIYFTGQTTYSSPPTLTHWCYLSET